MTSWVNHSDGHFYFTKFVFSDRSLGQVVIAWDSWLWIWIPARDPRWSSVNIYLLLNRNVVWKDEKQIKKRLKMVQSENWTFSLLSPSNAHRDSNPRQPSDLVATALRILFLNYFLFYFKNNFGGCVEGQQ